MNLDFTYTPPDFEQAHLKNSPLATLEPAPADGIAPANYHATSNHPEYIKIAENRWVLAPESRMDAVFVVKDDRIEVVEARNLKKGDMVVTGRTENGEEGILVHEKGFEQERLPMRINLPFAHGAPGRRPFPIPMTLSTKYSNTTETTDI